MALEIELCGGQWQRHKNKVILTSSVHHNAAQDAILATLDRRVVVISAVHCHRVEVLVVVLAATATVRVLGIHGQGRGLH